MITGRKRSFKFQKLNGSQLPITEKRNSVFASINAATRDYAPSATFRPTLRPAGQKGIQT